MKYIPNDYVLYYNKIHRVIMSDCESLTYTLKIDNDYIWGVEENELQSIILSSRILLLNDYIKNNNNWEHIELPNLIDNAGVYTLLGMGINIKYIHELQHILYIKGINYDFKYIASVDVKVINGKTCRILQYTSIETALNFIGKNEVEVLDDVIYLNNIACNKGDYIIKINNNVCTLDKNLYKLLFK